MGFRGKLIEFLVMHDLLPARIRWKKSVSGIGRLFCDVFYMLDANQRKKLTELMYEQGFSDADKVAETLKIKRNLHGCAVALMAGNRVYGIKSRIAKEDSKGVIIHATECLWNGKKNWTPAVCASIENYDVGLVKGIDKNVEYYCTKRRSKGDNFCEVILKRKIEH